MTICRYEDCNRYVYYSFCYKSVCVWVCGCVYIYVYILFSHKGMAKSFVTPWTVAYQAPLSMQFSRQEYWSGLPFPSAGNLPDPAIKPVSPTLQADSLPLSHQGACVCVCVCNMLYIHTYMCIIHTCYFLPYFIPLSSKRH